MFMNAVDSEVQRHRQTWVAFTRFLTWSSVGVAVVLILMGMFLL